jgi:hypothetical protein
VNEIILVCDVQPLDKSPQASTGGLAVLGLRITRGDCGLIVPTPRFPKLVADVPFAKEGIYGHLRVRDVHLCPAPQVLAT